MTLEYIPSPDMSPRIADPGAFAAALAPHFACNPELSQSLRNAAMQHGLMGGVPVGHACTRARPGALMHTIGLEEILEGWMAHPRSDRMDD